MLVGRLLGKNALFRKLAGLFCRYRAKTTVKKIMPFLKKGAQILDVGSGTCEICNELRKKGFSITPIDIGNFSIVDGISPKIYGGKRMPFRESEYNTALVLTVLHHVTEPEKLLRETKRVSKRIIITEDIFEGKLQKYLTHIMDCITNAEASLPHMNKTDKEWRKTFKKLGIRLVNVSYERFFLIFSQAVYCLEK